MPNEEKESNNARSGRRKSDFKEEKPKKIYPAHHYFFQMLRDWRNGDYPRSQVKTLLLLTAAILYIVMPLDIIPDVILGLGFIDDAAVLGLIWTMIKKELSQYEKWRLQ